MKKTNYRCTSIHFSFLFQLHRCHCAGSAPHAARSGGRTSVDRKIGSRRADYEDLSKHVMKTLKEEKMERLRGGGVGMRGGGDSETHVQARRKLNYRVQFFMFV